MASTNPAQDGRTKFKLFAADLDGTLLGKPDATTDFAITWRSIPKEERPVLVYNTGRLVDDCRRVISQDKLPKPDYIICGVGTEIVDMAKGTLLKDFDQVLDEGWDRELVEKTVVSALRAERQPEHNQSAHKSSWYFYDATERHIGNLENALEEAGLDVTVVYSSGRDLDVLPKFANKGNALSWLVKHLGIKGSNVLVAGDTGNDSAMFELPGCKGIVVENAQPELIEAMMGREGVYSALGTCAEGVLEGLKHFGVIDAVRSSADETFEDQPHEQEIQHLFEEEKIPHSISKEELEYLHEAYEHALTGLRRCITPLGFSACSLEDNISRGTDENYHSVWGRDGAITILGSLCIDDPDIAVCQRKTLETLLDHMSTPGQIPANVQISNSRPDYSGIGGIASIDSGLWVIIAFYEYVRKTKDFNFLRRYHRDLQRAMDWLSAHDSNNDALLEIPESSDWMDLFARNYNVLYDEVLWYHANICYGRLQEFMNNFKRAGDYIRWSQSIKASIHKKFWPSTSEQVKSPTSFADIQYSMGDTSYLLAQVTPFGFDWRCDVYANILAFLFNVIDPARARIAFRFMWGVGANEPWPVKNLYPVVNAGDPDWRAYYTVNLLNLPNHYHNGGIWPFIGGQWVRFITKLGLNDIAVQELLRLAQLNERGISNRWEFTEWAHGLTGRPMGKMFQAWSCSEFIYACKELGIK